MKAMARQRSHSIQFKRQVAQEFIAGESLYALSKRHDISRQLIRVWVEKYEAGALDEDERHRFGAVVRGLRRSPQHRMDAPACRRLRRRGRRSRSGCGRWVRMR